MISDTTQALVSVVIPTCGRRELLELTLNSVFAQTMPQWEAIVVDDHSPDDTAAYLQKLAETDPRVRPLTRQGEVGGANVARNQGLAASVGRYVIFLDSDDLLEPDCLELRTQYLEAHPDLDFTVHAMRCFETTPNDCDCTWNSLTDEDDFERYLRMDGPWQTTGATWRRTALDRIGPWDPQLLSLQDLDFHIRSLGVGLRYKKINAWDCHYRLPHKRKSISNEKRTLAQYLSHVKIADRLLAMDDSVLDATADRRDLLVGFCFLLASRCAQKGNLFAGLSLWNRTRRRGLVGPVRFAQGIFALLSEKKPNHCKRLRESILSRWPESWLMIFRDTYLKGPLPPRATAEIEQEPSRPCNSDSVSNFKIEREIEHHFRRIA
jgi:glycosyltransferase involved in cell wall biosynthesis